MVNFYFILLDNNEAATSYNHPENSKYLAPMRLSFKNTYIPDHLPCPRVITYLLQMTDMIW
jgi:hypothetical protein